MFQSTLPCGERRIYQIRRGIVCRVSIHAPMWGATKRPHRIPLRSVVSIHAPMWGATGLISVPSLRVWFQSTLPCGERHTFTKWQQVPRCFNPRSHVGSDRRQSETLRESPVSIHAPMWGATPLILQKLHRRKRFNPRSHVGSDVYGRSIEARHLRFNPRSHVGSDLHSLLFSFTMSYNTIFAKEPYITINYTVILTMLCLIC